MCLPASPSSPAPLTDWPASHANRSAPSCVPGRAFQGAIWDPEAYTVNYRDYRDEHRTSAKKATELRLQGKPAGGLRRALRYGLPDWN